MTFTKSSTTRKAKAALYIRVSTVYQVDKDSLPFQKQELINMCKYLLNIEDFEIFEDAGYSAKNTDRPSYQRMMQKVRRNEFTHVLVWKIDRISRNLLDFATMYDEFKKYHITFVSKNEQFDTSSAMGETMLKIILIFAELERKIDSERVTSIMLDRANKGLWNGARMPLGYHWDATIKYPAIDDTEAVTIRFIYDKYEEIHSSMKICRILNKNNIKTKRGGKWSSKTVSDIIRNPFYKGTYRYNYRESARGAIKDESEWIIIPHNHPAIITEEQWERCNHIMDVNSQSKNTSSFRAKKYTHLFSGVLKCSHCNGGFSSSKDKPRLNGWRPSTYRCNRASTMRDCNAMSVSDVSIGPFIFNYIANFVRLQRKRESHTLASIEKALLSGKCFQDVIGIDSNGLQDTLQALRYRTLPDTDFSPNLTVQPVIGPVSSDIDLELLRQEEENLKTALQRLFDLYLFDSSALSQKDYMLKKEELTGKLQNIENAIDKEIAESYQSTDSYNISFMKKASAFIVSQKILSKTEINFEELCLKCDIGIMKELITETIDCISIKAGKVEAITFKSGLVYRFIYKE